MWKDLTLEQKAEIMKMSVANGVTDINDIRALYDGSIGHEFKKGGSKKNKSSNNHWNKGASIYNELVSGGLTPMEAMGIIGNMYVESRFDPGAENNINGGHWGLVQNDKNINAHIKKYYGDTSYSSQMRFIIDGMTTGIKGAKQAPWIQKRFNSYKAHMKKVNDPGIAARYFHDDYEKSNNEGISQRIQAARYFNTYMGGTNPGNLNYTPNVSSSRANSKARAASLYYTPIDTNPIQLTPKIQAPTFDFTSTLQPLQEVQTPISLPMTNKMKPLTADLPSLAAIFSYLPDQQVVTPTRMELPQYSPTTFNLLNEPYVLFGKI